MGIFSNILEKLGMGSPKVVPQPPAAAPATSAAPAPAPAVAPVVVEAPAQAQGFEPVQDGEVRTEPLDTTP